MGKTSFNATQAGKLMVRMSDYYLELWDEDLWYPIMNALNFYIRHTALINKYSKVEDQEKAKQPESKPIIYRKIPQSNEDVIKCSLSSMLEKGWVKLVDDNLKSFALSKELQQYWKLYFTPMNLRRIDDLFLKGYPLEQSVPSDIQGKLKFKSSESLLENVEDIDVLALKDDYISMRNEVELRPTFKCEYFRFYNHFPQPHSLVNSPKDLLPYYLLDAASLLPVLALNLKPSDYVLDMCAAPGGKTVAIMQHLSAGGRLVANDISITRYRRLKKVIEDYIPKQVSEKQIVLRRWNGNVYGKEEPGQFDKILVDVPCSKERKVIREDFQNGGWSLKRMQTNAKLQTELLMSAIQSVRPGGVVVYSTCTIAPPENDGVIEQVLQQSLEIGINLHVDHDDMNTVMRLFIPYFFYNWKHDFDIRHGVMVSPLTMRNWGPIYFSKLIRLT